MRPRVENPNGFVSTMIREAFSKLWGITEKVTTPTIEIYWQRTIDGLAAKLHRAGWTWEDLHNVSWSEVPVSTKEVFERVVFAAKASGSWDLVSDAVKKKAAKVEQTIIDRMTKKARKRRAR